MSAAVSGAPPATRHRAPARPRCRRRSRQRPFGVVARRPGSVTHRGALGVQPGQQHGALHLRARDRRLVVDCRAAGRPSTVAGRQPPVGGRCARPSRSSGSATRRIGRRLSEASPVSVAANAWPASTPIRQPRRGAGVAGIERRRGRNRVRPGPAPVDVPDGAVGADGSPMRRRAPPGTPAWTGSPPPGASPRIACGPSRARPG